MFCPKCGSEIDDGMVFCTKCGKKIYDRVNLEGKDTSEKKLKESIYTTLQLPEVQTIKWVVITEYAIWIWIWIFVYLSLTDRSDLIELDNIIGFIGILIGYTIIIAVISFLLVSWRNIPLAIILLILCTVLIFAIIMSGLIKEASLMEYLDIHYAFRGESLFPIISEAIWLLNMNWKKNKSAL